MSKKNNTVVVDDEMLQVEGIDTLSEDERAKLYEEMEEIFRSRAEDKDVLRFDISGVSKGMKFPIVFNCLLIAIVGTAILATGIILNQRDKRIIESGGVIKYKGGAIAQEIISQNKEALAQQEEELAMLQEELNSLVSGQQDFDALYTKRIDEFEHQFEDDINTQQVKLRRQLESEKVTETEIRRRLAEQERQLRGEHEDQLAEYKRQQEVEKQQQIAEIDRQQAALQNQIQRKESERKALESEIVQKERELQAKTAEISSQLTETQSTLDTLKKNKEARDKAIREFNVYHQRIISLVNRGSFVEAKRAIDEALQQVNSSPFKTDSVAITYIDAYHTYNAMIDAAIYAQSLIESSSGSLDELQDLLSSQQGESTESIDNLQEKISFLEQANDRLSEEILVLSGAGTSDKLKTLARSNEDLKTNLNLVRQKNVELNTANERLKLNLSSDNALQSKYDKLQSSYNTLQNKINDENNQAIIEGLGLRKVEVNSILANVRLIANYLSLKQSGIEDNGTREQILSLVKQFKLYQSIIDILIAGIDPTGNLSF